MGQIQFVIGGARSGKSAFAEKLATASFNATTGDSADLFYLATAQPFDDEMRKRINLHQKRRPKDWKLIETTDLLNTLRKEEGPLLIDSIGGFVMKSIGKEQNEWSKKMNSLISLLMKRKSITIIVGEQVGWSLVSEYKIGNTYIERIGELQKRITKISKDNWLAINGRAIKIDEISIEITT